eukprot:Skav214455  [mRNA]  locus=scaffold1870:93380:97429:+ [translate_table: standard]
MVWHASPPCWRWRSTYDVSMDWVRSSETRATYAVSELADGRVLRFQTLDTEGTQMGGQTIFPHVSFMHGGYYQLCYSPDGSMAGNEHLNALVPVEIRVIGVRSECVGTGCLATERWDCFFSYRMEFASICRVDLRSFGGGRPGFTVEAATISKAVWTGLWGSDTYVCYCPNYDGPVDASIVACDDAPLAESQVAGILPQQPFSLRLQCPPGGTSCSGSSERLGGAAWVVGPWWAMLGGGAMVGHAGWWAIMGHGWPWWAMVGHSGPWRVMAGHDDDGALGSI